jgi:hypothetical protein
MDNLESTLEMQYTAHYLSRLEGYYSISGLGGIEKIKYMGMDSNYLIFQLNHRKIQIQNFNLASDKLAVKLAIKRKDPVFYRKVSENLVKRLLHYKIFPKYNFIEFHQLIKLDASIMLERFWNRYTPEQQNQLANLGFMAVPTSHLHHCKNSEISLSNLGIIIDYLTFFLFPNSHTIHRKTHKN